MSLALSRTARKKKLTKRNGDAIYKGPNGSSSFPRDITLREMSEGDWEAFQLGCKARRTAGGFFREGEKFFDSFRVGHLRIRVATESSNAMVLSIEVANKVITKSLFLFPAKKRSQPENDGNRVPASPGDGADADPEFV